MILIVNKYLIWNRFLNQAIIWQLVFLATSAAIFLVILLLAATKPIPLYLLPSIAGAYVTAWLIGTVTPGAPAGLGVRETVLLLLIGSHFTEQNVLFAALLMRVITLLGDSLFFAATLTLSNKNHENL